MRGPNDYHSLNRQDQDNEAAPDENRSGQMRREDLKLPQEQQKSAGREENQSTGNFVDDWERAEAADKRRLAEKVEAKEISESESIRQQKLFDQQYERKMNLEQAREAAAEARLREAGREREQDRER